MPIRLNAIVPTRFLKFGTVRAELLMQLDREIDIIDRMYKKTYRTWRNKPIFRKSHKTTANRLSAQTATDSDIMLWLDEGTKAHLIMARARGRHLGRLAFQTGFIPKTKPRTIGSGAGGRFGDFVYPPAVWHPGTKPRKFTDEIVNRRKDRYKIAMQRALDRGVKRFA